jgi:hypothetical protein
MAQSVARLLNNISLLGRKRSAVRARVESLFCHSGQFFFVREPPDELPVSMRMYHAGIVSVRVSK